MDSNGNIGAQLIQVEQYTYADATTIPTIAQPFYISDADTGWPSTTVPESGYGDGVSTLQEIAIGATSQDTTIALWGAPGFEYQTANSAGYLCIGVGLVGNGQQPGIPGTDPYIDFSTGTQMSLFAYDGCYFAYSGASEATWTVDSTDFVGFDFSACAVNLSFVTANGALPTGPGPEALMLNPYGSAGTAPVTVTQAISVPGTSSSTSGATFYYDSIGTLVARAEQGRTSETFILSGKWPGSASNTTTLAIEYGTTTALGTAVTGASANLSGSSAGNWQLEVSITISSVGATGTLTVTGMLFLGTSLIAVLNGTQSSVSASTLYYFGVRATDSNSATTSTLTRVQAQAP